MNTFTKLASISILALTVSACSDEATAPEADNVAETRMDDVDVIDGTISDDMVDVDASSSGDELAGDGEASESRESEPSDEESE